VFSLAAQDEGDKLIVVERGDLVFCFNFHPVNSYTDYRIGCLQSGPYKVRGKETPAPTCEPSLKYMTRGLLPVLCDMYGLKVRPLSHLC